MDANTIDPGAVVGPCPRCGGSATLKRNGERVDQPAPWLRWAITITHLYLCNACGSSAELVEIRARHASQYHTICG